MGIEELKSELEEELIKEVIRKKSYLERKLKSKLEEINIGELKSKLVEEVKSND